MKYSFSAATWQACMPVVPLRFAYNKYGAIWGQGEGLQGQSYAIPTMQGGVETIEPYVDTFIAFAQAHPELHFLVTPVGCGIAGFSEQEIAPIVNVQLIVELYSR